jgi:hypothetical protein
MAVAGLLLLGEHTVAVVVVAQMPLVKLPHQLRKQEMVEMVRHPLSLEHLLHMLVVEAVGVVGLAIIK